MSSDHFTMLEIVARVVFVVMDKGVLDPRVITVPGAPKDFEYDRLSACMNYVAREYREAGVSSLDEITADDVVEKVNRITLIQYPWLRESTNAS